MLVFDTRFDFRIRICNHNAEIYETIFSNIFRRFCKASDRKIVDRNIINPLVCFYYGRKRTQKIQREIKPHSGTLAEKLKVTKKTIERWESGESKFPKYLELALKTIEREL